MLLYYIVDAILSQAKMVIFNNVQTTKFMIFVGKKRDVQWLFRAKFHNSK